MTKKRSDGRPSKYSSELCDLICERIATHDIGLERLCKMFEDMPDKTTIYQWRFKHPEFATKYARAKTFQCELLADSMYDLANEISTYQDSDGNARVDSGSVQAQRLKIDTLKWTLSKLLPKVYGEQKQIDDQSPSNTLNEIQTLVSELNKKNMREF